MHPEPFGDVSPFLFQAGALEFSALKLVAFGTCICTRHAKTHIEISIENFHNNNIIIYLYFTRITY